VVNLLAQNTRGNEIIYRHHTYDVSNTRIDLILSQSADFVQQAGYAAFPVPASRRRDTEKIASVFLTNLLPIVQD